MALYFCPLYSGSSGNCALVGTETTRILVDAGLTGKAIVSALDFVGQRPEGLSGIVITHEHTDHCKAAGILSRRFDIPIYANAGTWAAMVRTVGKIAPHNQRIFDSGRDFFLGNLEITPYSISHDAAEPVGFGFYAGGRRVVQMTDLGYVSADVLDFATGADLVLMEANHDLVMLENGPYPAVLKRRIAGRRGHLSNDAAGELACELARRGTRQFILGHLSGENNTEEIAFETVESTLVQQGAKVGIAGDVQLHMAHRQRVADVFRLE